MLSPCFMFLVALILPSAVKHLFNNTKLTSYTQQETQKKQSKKALHIHTRAKRVIIINK